MKEKIKDIAVRAGKTFWQAMLATALVAFPEIVELIPSGWEALKPVLISAVVGAIAAGLSATYNGVIAPIIDKVNAKRNEVIIKSERNDDSLGRSN
jgi:hypothetical protein